MREARKLAHPVTCRTRIKAIVRHEARVAAAWLHTIESQRVCSLVVEVAAQLPVGRARSLKNWAYWWMVGSETCRRKGGWYLVTATDRFWPVKLTLL
jgi:hypothetical protein